MTRVAIVAGICVPCDAISAAVSSQARTILGLEGIESVEMFSQLCLRTLPCPSYTFANSWELLRHERFQRADIAIFHWGIHFDLFDTLAIAPGRVPGAIGPRPVVHFHNCSPRELVEDSMRSTIDRSIGQAQLLVGSDVPVWTFSPFNVATLHEWGVRPDQIDSVPFAVEPPRSLNDRRRTGYVDLLCVGRMVPAKAQHVVIEAIALLPAELRRRVTLRIAGNALFSSPDYVRSIEQMVLDRGLRSIVHFVGQPNDIRLWELYEESHVLVTASRHEGLCMPVLEAYHAGCRVIGTDAGNLPFIVQPPDPVVPVDDPRELALAITRVAHEVLAGSETTRDGIAKLLASYSALSAADRLGAAIGRLTAPSSYVGPAALAVDR